MDPEQRPAFITLFPDKFDAIHRTQHTITLPAFLRHPCHGVGVVGVPDQNDKSESQDQERAHGDPIRWRPCNIGNDDRDYDDKRRKTISQYLHTSEPKASSVQKYEDTGLWFCGVCHRSHDHRYLYCMAANG